MRWLVDRMEGSLDTPPLLYIAVAVRCVTCFVLPPACLVSAWYAFGLLMQDGNGVLVSLHYSVASSALSFSAYGLLVGAGLKATVRNENTHNAAEWMIRFFALIGYVAVLILLGWPMLQGLLGQS